MAETFQYITCYSLSIIRTNHQSSPSFVSIHHMLLFISSPPASSQLLHGVSIHHMLLFITVFTDSSTPLQGFNTSHVTLYLNKCHRLFPLFLVSIHHMLLFICMWPLSLLRWSGFNTSHVTLYLHTRDAYVSSRIRFNTSHVTLYLSGKRDYQNDSSVSIHHMLLFITEAATAVDQAKVFQYITCYSLSVNCLELSEYNK